MKHITSKQEFNSYPPSVQIFLLLWKYHTNRAITKQVTYSEWKELALCLTNELQHDTSIERKRSDDQSATFNNVLDLGEMIIAWDGREPIETLSYLVIQRIKKRLVQEGHR